jgi:OmpR-family two-component system manganese-sensing sensor histidine kinase
LLAGILLVQDVPLLDQLSSDLLQESASGLDSFRVQCPMMTFVRTRRRLLLLNLGGLLLLLLVVATGVYALVRGQLYQRLQQDLALTAQTVTFSVEWEPKGFDYSESIHLTQRPLELDLKDQVTVQWLDSSGKVLAARGNVPMPVQKLSPRHYVYDQTAASYTLDAQRAGKIYGYARVSASLLPLQHQLSQLLGLLAATGTAILALAGLVGWWWTGRMLRPLQHAYQELELFTGSVSHELRTPLTAMLTQCQSLLRHYDSLEPAEIREGLEELGETSADMARLVHDLLLLAQARRHQPDLALQPVSLPEVVEEARAQVVKGASIQLQGPPASLLGHRPYVQQILRNLLENAAHYSEPGSPVEVRWEARGAWLEVVVSDHGPGLDSEACERVFEPFWRADRARSRHAGGTGLGLAIAAGMARAQHGQLSVTSQPGQGSHFCLKLPLHPG